MGGGIGMRDVLAQQNRDMEALERRGRERARGMPPGAGPQSVGVPGGAPGMQQQRPVGGPRLDDDDSADEIDQISTRSLALTRYKRNHELMNEVFMYAAFGDPTKTITDRSAAAAVTTPYSIFNTEKMEEKIVCFLLSLAQHESISWLRIRDICHPVENKFPRIGRYRKSYSS